jgi:hypothetical protein
LGPPAALEGRPALGAARGALVADEGRGWGEPAGLARGDRAGGASSGGAEGSWARRSAGALTLAAALDIAIRSRWVRPEGPRCGLRLPRSLPLPLPPLVGPGAGGNGEAAPPWPWAGPKESWGTLAASAGAGAEAPERPPRKLERSPLLGRLLREGSVPKEGARKEGSRPAGEERDTAGPGSSSGSRWSPGGCSSGPSVVEGRAPAGRLGASGGAMALGAPGSWRLT